MPPDRTFEEVIDALRRVAGGGSALTRKSSAP
jgi:hypothetical protein